MKEERAIGVGGAAAMALAALESVVLVRKVATERLAYQVAASTDSAVAVRAIGALVAGDLAAVEVNAVEVWLRRNYSRDKNTSRSGLLHVPRGRKVCNHDGAGGWRCASRRQHPNQPRSIQTMQLGLQPN